MQARNMNLLTQNDFVLNYCVIYTKAKKPSDYFTEKEHFNEKIKNGNKKYR